MKPDNSLEIPTLYPWQADLWQRLWRCKTEQRLPHAFLFVGMSGVGKKALAEVFARAMLCATPTDIGLPCGQCQGCYLIQAQSHPDMLRVEPEANSNTIKIDQIRNMIEFVSKTALQGMYRVVIIHPATNMNIYSANALLKTLEEPAPHTLIMLVCDQDKDLPATIRSRCQRVLFSSPPIEMALPWLKSQVKKSEVDCELLLKIANGSPLRALQFADKTLSALRKDLFTGLVALAQQQADPLRYAAAWQDKDITRTLELMLSFLVDLLRIQTTEAKPQNTDYESQLRGLRALANDKLLSYIDYVQQAYRHMLHSANLNKQLLLEDILIRWTHHVFS